MWVLKFKRQNKEYIKELETLSQIRANLVVIENMKWELISLEGK